MKSFWRMADHRPLFFLGQNYKVYRGQQGVFEVSEYATLPRETLRLLFWVIKKKVWQSVKHLTTESLKSDIKCSQLRRCIVGPLPQSEYFMIVVNISGLFLIKNNYKKICFQWIKTVKEMVKVIVQFLLHKILYLVPFYILIYVINPCVVTTEYAVSLRPSSWKSPHLNHWGSAVHQEIRHKLGFKDR